MDRPALSVCFLLALSLCACGGGGGGGDDGWDGQPITGTGSSGPGLAPGTGGGNEPFTWNALAKSGSSLITSAEFRIVRSQAEFDALCALISVAEWESVPPPSGPPTIDFDTTMVVAVFLGTRPYARSAASIVNIVPQGAGIHVDYEEFVPTGSGCPAPTPGPSQPFALATCTRVEGSATFSGTTQNRICPPP
jgi:hypothetical protein